MKTAFIQISIALAFIAGVPQTSRSEPLAQQVGDIFVPPPKDMVNVADYSPHFRKLASAYPSKPFGLYYLLSEFKDIDNGTRIMASRSAEGDIAANFSTESAAKLGFAKHMAEGEKEFAKMKFSSAEFQKALEVGQKSTNASLPTVKIAVSGMAILDMNLSQATRATIVAVVNSSVTAPGKNIEFTLVYCMGWQLVGKKVVNLVYAMPLEDASTPTVAKAALEEWMDSIEKKNAH